MAVSKRAARQIPRQYDEDEDEEPTPSPRGSGRPPANTDNTAVDGDDDDDEEESEEAAALRRGWSAGEQTQQSTSSFAQSFKVTEQGQVVKFLEDEPYVNYTRHWLERQTPTGRAPRSYTCLKSFNKRCPLCEDASDRPQAVSAFNIAVIGDDGVPVLKSWDCGPKLFGILKGYANDTKVAPLSKGYFMVSRTGKRGTVNHQVVPIKPRALEEDYDIVPPTQAELDKLGKYDEEIVPMPKTKDLEAIAVEIADEY
jgi:hypothetical protein